MLRSAYVGLIAAIVAAACLVLGCESSPRSANARGQAVFDTCRPCHGNAGAGDATLGAPPIAGLPEWYVTAQLQKFQGDIRGAHPDDMEGHRMRPMARTLYRPGDLEAVAKYVAALPPTTAAATLMRGDRTAGEARYAVCTACHGVDGKGNQDLGAPPLVGQADWYMASQLAKFKNGMRGAHPEDITGMQMAAMATTLEDSTAIHDVVAYIRTLAR